MKLSFENAGRIAAILLTTTSVSAFAQSAPAGAAAAEEDNSGFQEIVVTARRRSENVSNVPTAIQAISSEALIQRGIKNETDLQTAVSGLVIRAGASTNQLNYVIRGESVEPYSGSSPGVQPYFNEVALSGNAATAFYDVENVQVLKGPQGTLFGRNSTGGAVLYQSATPKDELGGFGSIQYGNHKKLILEGAVNVPFGDMGALRVAGTYQSGGAYVRNIYDGKLHGDNKVGSGRATLKLTPTDELTNTLMIQYSEFSGTNGGNRIIATIACGDPANKNPNLPSCYAFPGNPDFERLVRGPTGSIFPGYPDGFIPANVGFRDLPAYLDSLGKFHVANNAPLDFDASDRLLTNNTTYDFSEALTVKNIFGYGKTKRNLNYDNDGNFMPYLQAGGGLPGGNQRETRHTRIISNEFQIQGKALDNKLNYIVGLFYSNSLTYNNSPITGLFKVGSTIGVFRQRYKSESKDISKAIFAQATYAVTDKLNFTGGIRQAWDKLSLRQLPGTTITGPSFFHTKNDDISYTVSIDYHFTPTLMGYVSSRGSWRVGGYNPFIKGIGNRTDATVGGNYFPPEKVRDIELGFKFNGRLGDMPLRINTDIFNAWIRNNQKTAYGVLNGAVTSTTITAPRAKVSGFEIDGDIAPVENLHFGGNFTYTDARYGSEPGIAFASQVVFGPYGDVPKYQGTLYGEVIVPLEDNGELRFHVDGYGQTSQHLSNLGNSQNPFDLLDGYVLLNGRIDWADPAGFKGLTASLFIKNLTNKEYFVGGSGGIGIDGKNTAIFGQSRSYGGVLRYEF